MAEVKKNTADRVYENLFHMLVSGDYAPGDRIPSEHELKERFNVSRNTIRAALNRMNALGIIETRQGDGTYLKGVGTGMYINSFVPAILSNSDDLMGLLAMRRGVEVSAARLAAVNATEKELQEERERLGLNDPVLVQYGRWLGKVLHGDFGTSYSNGKPVAELLSVRLLPTLKLAFSALILMLLVAVPLGMLSAVYKNTWVDYLVRGVTFLGVSIPNFWVGLILLYVVALKFSLLPVISTGDGFEKIILPAITLAFAMAGKYTRQVRTAVLEELNKDYVTGARARGMSEQEILWKQVFPNALLPLITLLGLSLGNLLGGTAVVEVIFTYPGLGNLAVQAITAYDYSLIQGYVLWVALIYMVINLLVDMSYTFVDPRIRRNERG